MKQIRTDKRQETRDKSTQTLNSQLSTLNPRGGFSLIELMVVIVVLMLLVGLLMPAISGPFTSHPSAEVRTEISRLDAAISSFKAEYDSIEPPSSITLSESSSGWTDPRSKTILRRIWPQFDFSQPRDLNGDGDTNDIITFSGEECLVFFLGGVMSSERLIGFAKNPADPFNTTDVLRIGPFFEFDSSRLIAGTAYPVYLDPSPIQTNPYVYFSSYDGLGYESNDSSLANIYLQPGGSVAYKPNSHQLISPGADGDYGTGGIYDADTDTAPSEADRDNITNFSSGRLVP